MFRKHVKGKILKCNNKEDYHLLKKELDNFGVSKFIWDMENLKIFKDGYINEVNNPFAQIILKTQDGKFVKRNYTNFDDFIMLTSKENKNHKLVIPKSFEWDTFNVLTLSKKHLPMLETMEKIALSYINKQNISDPILCFHCYPFNSVNTLHLHIVNPILEPQFMTKNHSNLPLNDVLQFLRDS